MNESTKNWQAWALFALLALIWGSSFILMKYGLQSFSYSQIGMIRVSLAFWFTFVIAFRRLRFLRKKDILPLLVVGLLGNAIPYLLFPLAVTKLDSGLVGILNSLVPLFTLIIGVLFYKAKVGIPSVVGILIGLAGAVWLLIPGIEIDPTKLQYGALPILATLCYAISINTLSSWLKHLDSLTITLLSLLFVGIPATIYVFTTDFLHIMQTDDQAWISLSYVAILGIVGSSLAVIIFNYLIKNTDSLFASSVTYLIPLVALIWGLVDGENIGIDHVFGMGAILLGVYVVNARRKYREKKN
ncbi:DMT(drug/metabolite transporter) superfamily permease [Owenweeksia hongkongensis DSM 17368]|uniref:DMT(Drug/metabolite transporter) superfamily permease n=1 Tax=Owenweeksia hongkongensis (strain DSM 17368 / CIP 108786 / JCM 12287 / NRRL B-23963 / UST20020801) TaxID=926562 RepID=G8R004_OWEHD|nr:DMT family transporter [Owenweeksia hongkongensis]AEV32644.1 DMT(drug/metabolite transporter) superfamily permease [Owenweeksia hongkongensis DSM 17368]